MRRSACLALLLLSALAGARAAQPSLVAFQECLRCAHPPVIDGKLEDPCWQGLPVMDLFYKYWTPTPEAPPLKTAARVCYDDRGFHLGVTLYEEHLDKVKATITSRDDPLTWTDDCVEIMIDPSNRGTGYFKFCTNLNAARYDEKSTDMVLDGGWNVEGWKVATSKGDGAWFIEFYLPWSDIGQAPREGDVWSFDLVRYGYSSGGFKGVTWSLGGAGAAPAKFGYLGFGRFEPFADGALARIAQAARTTKGDTFRLLLPQQVLTCAAGQWQREALRDWLGAALKASEGGFAEAQAAVSAVPASGGRAALDKSLAALAAELAGLRAQATAEPLSPGAAAVVFTQLQLLDRKLSEARWEGKLWELVESS